MHEQKIIEVLEKDGQEVIKLTDKGHVRFLQLKMEDIINKSNRWDGKWRIVIYDISKMKKGAVTILRRMLTKSGFLRLQKSVYLTPFKCAEEIEYLRQYFGVGQEVIYLEISKLENEQYYKEYFGV